MMAPNEGFIFVNAKGEYAVQHMSQGFRPVAVISWVPNINAATIFRSATPPTAAAVAALPAVSKRSVTITNWPADKEAT